MRPPSRRRPIPTHSIRGMAGTARLRTVADPEALGAWWARHVGRWAEAGIAGLRLLGLTDAPGAAAPCGRRPPELVLIGWTPGMPRPALTGLLGLSYVVSSLPWWDLQATWFWDELEALRSLAPVLACPETPFGPRSAAAVHNPAELGGHPAPPRIPRRSDWGWLDRPRGLRKRGPACLGPIWPHAVPRGPELRGWDRPGSLERDRRSGGR